VPTVPVRLRVAARELIPHFAAIRAEQGIPEAMPAAVEAAAVAAAATPLAPAPGAAPHADRREVPLLTIDPPGSMDLDQALAITRGATGPLVRYAIADVAAAVPEGGVIDAEARRRGTTVYMPDVRAPLYPPAVGEGACSLLPGEDRRALLWTIALDADGEPRDVAVERALVRSRRRLTYAEAQAEIDGGAAEETLALLREVGLRRLELEAERGGVSLSVPVQEVVSDDGGYGLRYETTLPVEDWNAQVSLLTGICAARIMVEGGLGLFRTLAPAEPRDLSRCGAAPSPSASRGPRGRATATSSGRSTRPTPRTPRSPRARPGSSAAPPTRPGAAAPTASPRSTPRSRRCTRTSRPRCAGWPTAWRARSPWPSRPVRRSPAGPSPPSTRWPG
jgi:hypothetical protein